MEVAHTCMYLGHSKLFLVLPFFPTGCGWVGDRDYRTSLALPDFRLLYTLLCPLYSVKNTSWLGCDIVIVRAERYLGGRYLPWIQNSVSSFQNDRAVHQSRFLSIFLLSGSRSDYVIVIVAINSIAKTRCGRRTRN